MTALEKKQMKEIMWELIQENKSFFKEIIEEIINPESSNETNSEDKRTRKIENIIKKDFQRYKKIFEALA